MTQIPQYLLVHLKLHRNTSKTMSQVTKYFFFLLLHAKAAVVFTHLCLWACTLCSTEDIHCTPPLPHPPPPSLRCCPIIAPSVSAACLARSLVVVVVVFVVTFHQHKPLSVLRPHKHNKYWNNWHIKVQQWENSKMTTTARQELCCKCYEGFAGVQGLHVCFPSTCRNSANGISVPGEFSSMASVSPQWSDGFVIMVSVSPAYRDNLWPSCRGQ